MKRGATKAEIIRTTQELIARNGIRAVRVDEIVQSLGISKRTLYELFADKTELVTACLDAMSHEQMQRIESHRRRSSNPLRHAMRLTGEYVDTLYTVDSCFLSDIRHKVVFADHYDEHREHWRKAFARNFERCKEVDLLLPEIEAGPFAERIMDTLFELRRNGAAREDLNLFSRTLLRGAATRQGIDLIDHRKG